MGRFGFTSGAGYYRAFHVQSENWWFFTLSAFPVFRRVLKDARSVFEGCSQHVSRISAACFEDVLSVFLDSHSVSRIPVMCFWIIRTKILGVLGKRFQVWLRSVFGIPCGSLRSCRLSLEPLNISLNAGKIRKPGMSSQVEWISENSRRKIRWKGSKILFLVDIISAKEAENLPFPKDLK